MMEDSYTLHLAEGWSVLLNSKEGIYTVSRDRRQMTFNTQLPLPPCLATYNLTFEHGKKQMTIPSHVVDVLNSRVGVTAPNPFLSLEDRITTPTPGGKADETEPKAKRRLLTVIKTDTGAESGTFPDPSYPTTVTALNPQEEEEEEEEPWQFLSALITDQNLS